MRGGGTVCGSAKWAGASGSERAWRKASEWGVMRRNLEGFMYGRVNGDERRGFV